MEEKEIMAEIRQDIIDLVAAKLGASNVEVGTYVRHYAEEFEKADQAEEDAPKSDPGNVEPKRHRAQSHSARDKA